MDPALERFLQDAHARDPGGSARTFGRYRDRRGQSSYQRLAERLPTRGRVLDLGCGDGPLLELLGPRRALGLDLSPAELSAARARLGPRARLLRARAGALPLADASVQAVSAHMVLMLLRPLAPALAEIARVLRPGGVLLAVLSGGEVPPGAALAAFREEWRALPARARGAPPIGEAWSRRPDELAARLRALGLEPREERLALARRGRPEELWPDLAGMYDVATLPAQEHEALGARVRARWGELAGEGGSLELGLELRLLAARKRAAPPGRGQ